MVACSHVLSASSPTFVKWQIANVNIGYLGVLMFFIVSGIVISASMERTKNVQLFWRQRFWRLFPAYLVSLGICALLFLWFPGDLNDSAYGHIKEHFWLSFAANLTMIQGFLGFDNFIPAYWTLAYEMLFYVMLSGVFLAGMGAKAYRLIWVLIGFLYFSAILGILKHGHVGSYKAILVGYFWLGIWFQRFLTNQINAKQFWTTLVLFQLSVMAAWYVNIQKFPGIESGGAIINQASPGSMAVSFLGSTLLFLSIFALRSRSFPKFLVQLGTVSYSLYLFHWIAIRLAGHLFDPTTSTVLFIVTSISFIAVITGLGYRLIELPSLNQAKMQRAKVLLIE
jgi:peptidoglycan/LPS O-acetylase OafA/YrhL